MAQQEEPKQDLPIINGSYGCIIETKRQETLEEAAENYLRKWRSLNIIHLSNIIHAERCKNDFIAGAKWQEQRMYSEKEVYRIIVALLHTFKLTGESSWKDIAEWFEQNKKK